jgi:Domain of unknown function (DUF1707)
VAGPGDEVAVAYGQGRGQFRASHADREQVIELLKVAFVQDRLTKDELDVRVGQALAARTGADLAVLTADISAEPTVAWLPRPPARAASGPTRPLVPVRRRPLARAAAGSGGCLALAAAAVGASFILDPGGPGIDRPWAGLMLLVAQYAVIAGVCMLWRGVTTSVPRRRQLPPRPGPGRAVAPSTAGRRGGTGRGPVPPGPPRRPEPRRPAV